MNYKVNQGSLFIWDCLQCCFQAKVMQKGKEEWTTSKQLYVPIIFGHFFVFVIVFVMLFLMLSFVYFKELQEDLTLVDAKALFIHCFKTRSMNFLVWSFRIGWFPRSPDFNGTMGIKKVHEDA